MFCNGLSKEIIFLGCTVYSLARLDIYWHR